MEYDLVAVLNEWRSIDRSRLLENSDRGFEFRIKIQKAAFLLHHLKIKPFDRIDFNQYLHGPYAPELARAYFKGKPLEFEAGEDVIGKLKKFMDHDNVWLEIATSTLLTYELYPDISRDEALDVVQLSKPWVKKDDFDKIYKYLVNEGLIAAERLA